MKVVFISNFLNHHQLPFCQAMVKKTGGEFVFIATTPVPQERLAMGYHDMNKQYSFVLCAYEYAENKKKAMELAVQCDVLMIGGFHIAQVDEYVKDRMKSNKLTFQYLERIYKTGVWHILSPRGTLNMLKYHTRYFNKRMYALCASAYTAWDLSLTGGYINKTYKWGYFPEVNRYDMDALMEKKQSEKAKILWAGRLIKWKHPEAAIAVAEYLKRKGYDFELNIIGNGVLEEALKQMIEEKALSDCVKMLGAMSPEAVREHMEEANIFLFTSDHNEGWGAVLNESMNSACAVVASHAIGSVPFLLKHGHNGFVYKNGDQESLNSIVEKLIADRALCEQAGRAAYDTMIHEWAPEEAADRLLELSEAIQLGKEKDLFATGPCSAAKRLSNSKMYQYTTQNARISLRKQQTES